MISIEIPHAPIPWRAPYVGSKGCFSKNYSINIETKKLIAAQYDGPLIDEAIIVDLTFYMPIPKATSKKKRLQMLSGMLRPLGTPDRTNLCKRAEDLLQGIVIKNDSKIVGGRVDKYYGEIPRSVINIFLL